MNSCTLKHILGSKVLKLTLMIFLFVFNQNTIAGILTDDYKYAVYETEDGLFRTPLPNGVPFKLHSNLPEDGSIDIASYSIAPDNKTVVYQLIDKKRNLHQFFSNADIGKSITPLVKYTGSDDRFGPNTGVDSENIYKYSSDGLSLILKTQLSNPNKFEIYKVNLNGVSSPVRLNRDLKQISPEVFDFIVSNNGFIYYAANQVAGGYQIYSVPLSGGEPIGISGQLPINYNVDQMNLSFDENYLVFSLSSSSQNDFLYSIDLKTNSLKQLHQTENESLSDFEISPDSQKVLYKYIAPSICSDSDACDKAAYRTVNIDGGDQDNVTNLSEGISFANAFFSNDSRSVYSVESTRSFFRGDDGAPVFIMPQQKGFVREQDGTTVELFSRAGLIENIKESRNGDYLIYSVGVFGSVLDYDDTQLFRVALDGQTPPVQIGDNFRFKNINSMFLGLNGEYVYYELIDKIRGTINAYRAPIFNDEEIEMLEVNDDSYITEIQPGNSITQRQFLYGVDENFAHLVEFKTGNSSNIFAFSFANIISIPISENAPILVSASQENEEEALIDFDIEPIILDTSTLCVPVVNTKSKISIICL